MTDGRDDRMDNVVHQELLEQDFSDLLHFSYCLITSILAAVPESFVPAIATMIHFKIFQWPQGCRIGRRLIELDEQFGSLLAAKGIMLERWVYEPREKRHD
jgi:hypothetical protein